ncbi:gp259 [Sphingomonas phage PAU]|uniref:baseplate protein n=1 Tax=Sphingomonas phage PAU TaxID=1150991 RepID=UPI0002573409|nr:baseplate protein [Sphingomonas phage PAU]AFF28257.1 gp259 [Sphingomonas phage PAU]
MSHQTYGIVADISDPMKKSRVRVRVFTRTDDESKISTDLLPWYTLHGNTNLHSLPALNEIVKVHLYDDDIHVGEYERIKSTYLALSDEDYKSGRILLSENLDNFEDSGIVEVSYRKETGLELQLRESKVTIRKDGSISLYNKEYDKYIHLSNESISLGSDQKSAEPGTLGQTNVDMLNQLNDTINTLRDDLSSFLKDQAKLALSNPRTAHLAKGYIKCDATITKLTSTFKKNSSDFEKTKSKIVTLD